MKKRLTLILAAVMLCMLLTGCETVMPNAGHQLNRIVLSKSGKAGTVDETAPFPGDKFINPLSGQLVDHDVSYMRPVGFMNNNIYQAIPQHGISQAEIVFEMNAEGNITRFLTIYQDIASQGAIGSIRSARPYYLDWALAFDAVLVHAGGSETANNAINRRGVGHINALVHGEPTFYRDQNRLNSGYAIEHTLFTTGPNIQYFMESNGMRTNHADGYECDLKFTTVPQTAEGTDAPEITVYMNSTKRTQFRYDPESKQYLMTEYDLPMTDGNTGAQLAVKNVLVFFTSYWREYSYDTTLLADMSGGSGYYACEGKMIPITWSRTDGGLWMYKEDGSLLELGIGHSFVCCADADRGDVILGW